MKKIIITKCINYIEKNCDYSQNKMKEIEYGLVSVYLTLSKTIFICFLSIILNIFKESIIFMIFFNIIRTVAFGLHAKKSWICWMSSTISFIIIPFMCKYITINHYIVQIICLGCVLLIFKNAPADTKKRPIVKKNRRIVFKALATCISLLYSSIAICLNNNFITNAIIFSLILENILISPTVYKIFKMPYNNYINFLKNNTDCTY